MKFGTKITSNMLNSEVILICSVYGKKYTFWANLVQKYKIVSLRWNLLPKLIQICWIQWWCILLPFGTLKYLFLANLAWKIKIVCLR